MKRASCGTCPFFVHRDINAGECHGGPPAAFPNMVDTPAGPVMGGAISVWPPVKATAWCAKHPVIAARAMSAAMMAGQDDPVEDVNAPAPAPVEAPAPARPTLVVP